MDTATKTGIDAAKAASKRVIQKTAKATGELLGIKQLIKLLQQANEKKKKMKKQKKQKKFTFHKKKDNKLLMTLDYIEDKMWHHSIKMEFLKIANFLKARKFNTSNINTSFPQLNLLFLNYQLRDHDSWLE